VVGMIFLRPKLLGTGNRQEWSDWVAARRESNLPPLVEAGQFAELSPAEVLAAVIGLEKSPAH